MCVLLHLLICTALSAHIIVVEALYKINIITKHDGACVYAWSSSGWVTVTC